MAQIITYNITIDDTSPQIAYSSESSSSLSGGWIQLFNDTPNEFPGQIGLRNESLHTTSKSGASFTIGFKGTAIHIYGLTNQSGFSVVLDDLEPISFANLQSLNMSNTRELLASFTGLEQRDHTLNFTAQISDIDDGTEGVVIFDRAVVTVSTDIINADITTEIINDTEMQFTGSWTFVNDSSLVPDVDHSFHLTKLAGDTAQFTFSNGSSVELGGLTNATAGLFNVTLSSESDPPIELNQQLSGESLFLSYTTLFYASGLDRDRTYTLTVTNVENKTLAIQGMNITVLDGGESAASSTAVVESTVFSRGAIAGIAVASSCAFLFLLAIIFLLWIYYRRRKRNQQNPHPRDLVSNMGPMGKHATSNLFKRGWFGKRGNRSSDSDIVAPPPSRAMDERYLENARSEEGSLETDSGFGLGRIQEKEENVTSIPYYDNLPRSPLDAPPRRLTRHRSLTLSRWSGWYSNNGSRPKSEIVQHPQIPPVPGINIVSPRPVRGYAPVSVLQSAHLRDSRSRGSSTITHGGSFLDIPHSSPFEVDFEKQRQARNLPPHTEQHRTINPSSLGAHARDMLVSFLDFASSGAASRRGSSRSRSHRRSESTRSATHSTNGNDIRPQQDASDSSGQSQSASTGLWTLSLSVDPPQRPMRESRQSQLVPTTAVDNTDTLDSMRHPFSMGFPDLAAASPISPTDSLPMSVSDINFRADDDESSPDGHSGQSYRFLPRHPPLPGTPHSYAFSSPVRSSDLATRSSHMRQMSEPNLGISDQRRPYVAQTSFGRRLAEVRAQAIESQASISGSTQAGHSNSPANSEQPTIRPPGNRLRAALPLPFVNFGRNSNASR